MNIHPLTSTNGRPLATAFALAVLVMSADLVLCIGAGDHLGLERSGAGCCLDLSSAANAASRAAQDPTADASLRHGTSQRATGVSGCVDCVDFVLSASVVTPASLDIPASPVSLSVSVVSLPQAAIVSIRRAPIAHLRSASLEFARVISLRC